MKPIILGSGITACSFLYHFGKKFPGREVINLDSQHLFPSVDKNIKVLVSENGISRGVSSLGDLLLDSFEYFENEFSNFSGVQKVVQQHLCVPDFFDESKFVRRFLSSGTPLRYGPMTAPVFGVSSYCYLINPNIFLPELRNRSRLNIETLGKTITNIEIEKKIELTDLDKHTLVTENLFCGAGPFSKLLPINFLDSCRQERHKIVFGGAWGADVDFGSDSFVLTVNMANLIYDAEFKRVQITGKTVEDYNLIDSPGGLEENHHLFNSIVENLPAFSYGQIISSLRNKGHKRQPYLYHCRKNSLEIVSISGAYKNGYTTAPFMAKSYFNL